MSLGGRSDSEAGRRGITDIHALVQTANQTSPLFDRECGQTAQIKEDGSQRVRNRGFLALGGGSFGTFLSPWREKYNKSNALINPNLNISKSKTTEHPSLSFLFFNLLKVLEEGVVEKLFSRSFSTSYSSYPILYFNSTTVTPPSPSP